MLRALLLLVALQPPPTQPPTPEQWQEWVDTTMRTHPNMSRKLAITNLMHKHHGLYENNVWVPMPTPPMTMAWVVPGKPPQDIPLTQIANSPATPPPPPQWPAMPQPGLTARGTIVDNIDGDTTIVEFKFRVHVRLDHCWAPESRTTDPVEKERGLKAKANLNALAPPGTPVVVTVPVEAPITHLGQLTTLGRVVGWVWPAGGGPSYNEAQVRAGVAAATKGGELGK